MAESSSKNRFQKLIDGLKNPDKEVKLMSIAAIGILRIEKHAELLWDLLSSNDEEILAATIKTLGQIGSPASVKYLVDFIGNPKEKLANEAYESLKKIDLSSVEDVVIKACSADQPNALRKKLVTLLSPYNDIRVNSLMNEIIGQTRDSELLTAAINYYIKFPSTERHSILKLLAGNGNWTVSIAANLALTRLKDESAYSQIKRLAKSSNAEIREIIVDALNCHPMIDDRGIYQILFDDNRAAIREKAIEGLQLFAADERINIIRRLLTTEGDNNIRIKLAKKAALEKSPLLFDQLFKLLQSSDEKLQQASIEALGSIGDKIVDPILIDYEKMPLLLREQLLLVLGKIGNPKAAYLVKEALFAKERWLRINAIEAAVSIKSKDLTEAVVNIIKTPNTDIWVMATAISAMSRLDDSSVVECIVPHLKHEDARVRANSIDALSKHKWEGLADACFAMLKDRNDRVRVNAAIALWQNGHSDVFSELEKMSRDKSRWVRASAVFALGQIDDPEGVPILIRMLRDSEDMVYRNVLEALSSRGDLRALIPMLNEASKNRLPSEFYTKTLDKFSSSIFKKPLSEM